VNKRTGFYRELRKTEIEEGSLRSEGQNDRGKTENAAKRADQQI